MYVRLLYELNGLHTSVHTYLLEKRTVYSTSKYDCPFIPLMDLSLKRRLISVHCYAKFNFSLMFGV